jgi:abnormal spindle-like microcephaly-associated protein
MALKGNHGSTYVQLFLTDMATEHSQKCCEELVAAGAINTLLTLIRSVSRSIPDQEILKHALSTLRNLARHPHLVEPLIDSHGSVEIILWEFLRYSIYI